MRIAPANRPHPPHPQSLRMTAVPVRLSACMPAVVTKQYNPTRAPPCGLCERRCAAIGAVGVEPCHFPTRAFDCLRRYQRAREDSPNIRQMHLPPCLIQGIQHVRPRAQAKRRIRYDDAACFLGRPRFFAPGTDTLAIACGNAWAAGDADDGSPAPPVGFSGVGPSPNTSTSPPRCNSTAT